MDSYHLMERLELFPEIQLHYDIDATAREMEEDGCIILD